ncbi:chorismate mutase [Phaeobacter sp. JH18-32]|uniref:chorismate mutase n=1 Tax=Phaeobacter TaxID=302485 RepID=UPI0030C9F4F1
MSERHPPQDCADMPALRQQIDRLDRELIALLAERAGYIDRAIELKAANNWPARIPARVEEVVGNARMTASTAGLDPDLVERLWRQLVEWSIAREAQIIREE